LQGFFQTTGRHVSLLAAVSEFVEASAELNGRTLGEVVEGYLRTAAGVKRQNIAEAIEEFLQLDAPRTHASLTFALPPLHVVLALPSLFRPSATVARA
jgi:hypothetical protein